MDINLARTFLAIIETGSFIDAAKKVHVTQSTISTRVKSLEDQLGKQLFERSKAGARLTPAGEQFQKHALAFMRIWQHAKLEVGLADEHRDHLAVGAQISLWDGFLLKWVAAMRERVPDVAISATMGFSAALIDRLSEGTLDLVVVYRPVHRPGLVIEHLFDEELVLVTSGTPSGRRPGEDYVFVNWGPEFQSDHAQAYPDLIHSGLQLDFGSIGVNYLLDKSASGYFPIRVARPYLKKSALKRVPRARKFVYPAYAAYPEERDEAAYAPFLDTLREFADTN